MHIRSIAKAAVPTLGIMAAAIACAATPQRKPLEIGQPAPDFSLPGVDGKTYTLGDFADAKVLVVVFTCNHCPTAQAYEDRLMQLVKDYKSKGVALVAINPNDPQALRLDELEFTDVSDSLDEMKIRAKEKGFNFPYLYDGDTQKAASAYGALATPHAFVFDAERKLRYEGRIDNSDIDKITSQDARNAIDALLDGKPVPVETTRVFGCSTKWSEKRQSAADAVKKWDAEPVEVNTIDQDGVKSLAKNETNKLRLLNVWATWCGPCVQEMPDLVTMNRMYRRREFELVTISIDPADQKEGVLESLKQNHVAAKNYLFDSSDKDKLAEALDAKWAGPVPYTLLVAPGGKIIYRHEGPFEALEVKRAIVDYMGNTAAGRRDKDK